MRRQGQGKKLTEAARLLARGELNSGLSDEQPPEQERDAALAAFGLVMEEPVPVAAQAEPPFYLWPEHLPALKLWTAVQTQWRHGFNGPTGLDYAGVRVVMSQLRVRKPRRRLAEVQIMEREMLRELARQRAEQKG